jgi:hypothetical protein
MSLLMLFRAGPVGNLAIDNFPGTNGDPLSSVWTNGTIPSGGSRQIQSNKGRFTTGGNAGSFQEANRISALVNVPPVLDSVALFSFTWPGLTRCYPSFCCARRSGRLLGHLRP